MVSSQTVLAADAAAKAKDPREDLGSAFLQCDGSPPHRSGAELAGRLLLVMATAGIAGVGEKADASKRLKGDEGVAACTDAIGRETDSVRTVQLTLARAIHHIEAKQFEAALSDAQLASVGGGGDTASMGYQHSLMLSSLELQAAALVRLGRPAEAEAVALKMAALAPYDLTDQQRALRYVTLTSSFGPDKQVYLDRLARLWPKAIASLAAAREWNGGYLAAEADFEAITELVTGFKSENYPIPPMAAVEAKRAVLLGLGGNMTHSNEVAADAQKLVDQMIASGSAINNQGEINEAEELLDFQAVLATFASGQVAKARAQFAARSRWVAPSPPEIADVTAMLRKGAAPAELTGALARDPQSIRASWMTARMGALIEADGDNSTLYSAIRAPLSESDWRNWADDVWNTADSPFVVEKKPKNTYVGEFVRVPRANGIPAGEALLMHCALLARARGVAGFVVFPVRARLDQTFVQFGNAGAEGLPAQLFVDAATVISALSSEYPDPNERKAHQTASSDR
jgi:hypothetical protein